MFIKRFQALTQIVGTITLAFLAVYGLIALLDRSATTSWAAQQLANATDAPFAQQAGLFQSSDSTVPLVMNYQGHVEDHEGNPLTGYYTMTFRIYDDVIGTTTLWQEEHLSTTVRSGYFTVLLGNNTALTNTLFTVPDRFIGVTVHPYDEMVPRQRFASVPYAIHSYHATQADHALALSAPDGNPQDALVVDNDGRIKWGTHRGMLNTNQGASIELGGEGTPYLDLSNDMDTDYDIRLSLTGDNELVVDGGNVGIGTTPSQKLDVAGNIHATGNVTVTGNIYASSLQDTLFVDNEHNIGIGVQDAEAKLDVAGNIKFTGQKVCSVVGSGWRDTFIVPPSWTAATCNAFRHSVAASFYQFGCIFEDSFSWDPSACE